MKRLGFSAAIFLLVVVALGWVMRTRITLRLIERQVAANLRTSLPEELPDGLHVALCGAGSPLPDPKRSGPCVAVIAGERLFVVDAGAGSPRVLARTRIPPAAIDAIFLTHFHSDHIDGLGELLLQRWAGGSHSQPVPVHGPEGVGDVLEGLDRAYAQSRGYRVAHHGEATVPSSGAGARARPFPPPADGEEVVVLEGGGVRVTAFRVSHPPIEPAVGYRFEYGGRAVVVSGDTNKSANLERFAEGADLLLHDALSRRLVGLLTEGARAAGRENTAKITSDILDYHASPVEAAEVARDAGVGHLVLYHIVPPLLLPPMEDVFLEGVDDVYEGPFTLARDGTLIVMEVESDSIVVDELL